MQHLSRLASENVYETQHPSGAHRGALDLATSAANHLLGARQPALSAKEKCLLAKTNVMIEVFGVSSRHLRCLLSNSRLVPASSKPGESRCTVTDCGNPHNEENA